MNQTEYEAWINGIKKNFPYYNPAPKDANNQEQFPIIATGTEYNAGILTIPCRILKQMKKCGFTVCSKQTIQYNDNHVYNSLLHAKQAGINLMFNCWRFYPNQFGVSISDTINHTPNEGDENVSGAFGGVALRDEPTYKDMTDTATDRVEQEPLLQLDYIELMKQDYPTIAFINLVGGFSPKFMVGIDGLTEEDLDALAQAEEKEDEEERERIYTKYLDTFQKQFKPSLFSFDLYPIIEKSALLYQGMNNNMTTDNDGAITVHTESFCNRLKQFADLGRAHGVPFWSYLQGRSYYTIKDSVHFAPPAKEQYLRFEAFSALAYGAKGLVLWSYPLSPNSEEEGFLSALINRRNEKTAAWYFAKNVNNEIQKYGFIFLGSSSCKTTRGNAYGFRPFSTTLMKIVSENQKNFLVGEFQVQREIYLMVVNMDALDYSNITITVQGANFTELTSVKSKEPGNKPLNQGDNLRILTPGGFRIFQYHLGLSPIG